MFDLEKAIQEWKKGFHKYPVFEDGIIADMEIHLRDEFESRKKAGLDAEEAFRAAAAQIGTPDTLSSEYNKNRLVKLNRRSPFRISRFMPALVWNYTKTALRKIRHHKVYSLINIMGLAVGMACCILILLWVKDELSFDKFHKNYSNIFQTNVELQGTKYVDNPLALAKTFKNQYPEVKRITRYSYRYWLIKHGDNIYNESGGLVDDDFLKIFTFPLLKGNPETVFASRESIVITERAAFKYFGGQNPIGKSVLINNRLELIVTGVLKDVPKNSHLQFDFLAPMELMGERGETSWSYEAWTYPQLEENVSLKDFGDKISGFIMEHDKRTNEKEILHIRPLSKVHLYALNGTDPILYIYIFLAIAAAVLIIACINFINLSTARSNTRAMEIGMRKVAGAKRADIIKQFIGE
jgi:putative ABC transport system permease protein